jgi:MinD-like ATPase involved in chromosome partitioning or flagellar assembly
MTQISVTAPVRIIVAVGRQQERRVLEACLGDRGLRVVGRCNSALELVRRVGIDQPDMVVIDDDLHLLDADRLRDLTRRRLRVVLLAHDADAERWQGVQALVLSSDANENMIRSGIGQALKREFGRRSATPVADSDGVPGGDKVTRGTSTETTQVVTFFGGPGAPGRTTMAVNLLAILGASRRTVLVDLDSTGSAVAAHIRALHPAWNVVDLALEGPRTSEDWDRALLHRLQPIGSYSDGARVLCGVGRPRERSVLSAGFVENLIAHLRSRFDHILLDLGDEPVLDTSIEALIAATALRAADHVLLVAAPDPVRLHHAQIARDEAAGVLDVSRTSLVLNRCRRGDDGLSSSVALQLPLLVRIPWDSRVERALADGQPAVRDPSSRLRAPLSRLAEAIADERLTLRSLEDAEQRTTRPLGWLRPLLAPMTGLIGAPR